MLAIAILTYGALLQTSSDRPQVPVLTSAQIQFAEGAVSKELWAPHPEPTVVVRGDPRPAAGTWGKFNSALPDASDWPQPYKPGTIDAPYYPRGSYVRDLLPRSEVAAVKVISYSEPALKTPGDVAKVLIRLWQAPMQEPFEGGWLGWAESAIWSIYCKIELKNGKTALMLTDGAHVFLVDAERRLWATRPA